MGTAGKAAVYPITVF